VGIRSGFNVPGYSLILTPLEEHYLSNPIHIPLPIPSLEEIGTPMIAPIEPGPPDLLPGFLPKQGQLVVAGETDIGKSTIAVEVCSSLSTNTPLWGGLMPTMPCRKILYVLGEHYKEAIQKIWQRTALPMTADVVIVAPDQLKYDKWLVTGGRVNMIAAEKFMHWAKGCDLIIFDPLTAFITGEGAENDNIQMRLLLDTMSAVAQEVGASSLILAHQGKPTIDKFGNEHKRTSYAIRGASGIEDAATNVFYLGRAPVELQSAETKGHTLLIMKKRKYKGDAPEEFRLIKDSKTLVSTLAGNRPVVELKRIETRARIERMQEAFPDMKISEVVKMVAAGEGVGESTVWRYLGGGE
jgi:hypothetical protein